jgi:serine protease Do
MKTALTFLRLMFFFSLLTAGLACAAPSHDEADYPTLPRAQYRSGQDVLDAFAPISAQTRNSIVELNVNEDTVALGAVVETNGLVLTKASEIKAGKLTCWLPSGKEVAARLLAVDDDDDVALVRVKAEGLKPIQWASTQASEGQWAITPGLADTPQAVGIISALPHRIRPQRALIGVNGWEPDTTRPTVHRLMRGFGAEKAGVKPGDVIVAVDGTTVTDIEQVIDILREFRDGQTVQIRFERAGQQFNTSIEMMTPRAGQEGYDMFSNERENRFSGDVSLRSEGSEQALEHDTVLEPWQCGGPLVNLDGQAIGLNIARASRVATYALPASLARRILAKLKSESEKP